MPANIFICKLNLNYIVHCSRPYEPAVWGAVCLRSSWERAVTDVRDGPLDGWPWRAAGVNFWNERHGFLTTIVSEVRQSGPWGQAVDGRPWRAAEMDFWNKRHGFLTPIVSEVCQSGPWGQAVDGRPWWAAGMDFWNKRRGFLAPIVSKVSQIGPWGRAVDGQPWRAAGMDFWNKRRVWHGICSIIRKTGFITVKPVLPP